MYTEEKLSMIKSQYGIPMLDVACYNHSDIKHTTSLIDEAVYGFFTYKNSGVRDI